MKSIVPQNPTSLFFFILGLMAAGMAVALWVVMIFEAIKGEGGDIFVGWFLGGALFFVVGGVCGLFGGLANGD